MSHQRDLVGTSGVRRQVKRRNRTLRQRSWKSSILRTLICEPSYLNGSLHEMKYLLYKNSDTMFDHLL